MDKKLKVAFVAGLSNKKLEQKLAPLAFLDNVQKIDLYRREKFIAMDKIYQKKIPELLNKSRILAEIYRFIILLINGYKYDLFIGCFQRYHGFWAMLAGKFWRKPVIQLVVTSIEWNSHHFPCKKTMMAADCCGVRGEMSKKSLIKLGYNKTIIPIHNYFEIDEMAKAESQDTSKIYDLITVADWAEEKDFPWMMNIIKELKAEKKGIKVALAGRDLEKNLDTMVRQLKIRDNLEFLGFLDDNQLRKAYSSSKFFILTSHTEGLPQAALEAMSYGLPCILTDVGECFWLIEDGKSGIVIKHGDTDQALAKIRSALYNSEIRASMGIEVEKRFNILKEDFSMESIAGNWEKLLKATQRIKKCVE